MKNQYILKHSLPDETLHYGPYDLETAKNLFRGLLKEIESGRPDLKSVDLQKGHDKSETPIWADIHFENLSDLQGVEVTKLLFADPKDFDLQ